MSPQILYLSFPSNLWWISFSERELNHQSFLNVCLERQFFFALSEKFHSAMLSLRGKHVWNHVLPSEGNQFSTARIYSLAGISGPSSMSI